MRFFQQAWRKIFQDGRYKNYDWTVKIDLDAVFFASRLKNALVLHTGPDATMLLPKSEDGAYRPIEAFSQAAVKRYEDQATRCETGFDASIGGEDEYIRTCMAILGVTSVGDDSNHLLGGKRDCFQHLYVAFHPMKSREAWQECARQSLAGYSEDDPDIDMLATPTVS